MTEWTEELLVRATGMKRAGIRMKDIAERLGVPQQALQQRLQRRGVRANLDGQHKRFKNTKQRVLFSVTSVEDTSDR